MFGRWQAESCLKLAELSYAAKAIETLKALISNKSLSKDSHRVEAQKMWVEFMVEIGEFKTIKESQEAESLDDI